MVALEDARVAGDLLEGYGNERALRDLLAYKIRSIAGPEEMVNMESKEEKDKPTPQIMKTSAAQP